MLKLSGNDSEPNFSGAGSTILVAYVYKSSRSTVFENPDIVKTCTVRDLKKDFVNCDEKGEGQ
ncbi:hypothetical protein [Escherichia coli]|uniref:hypothetical protein n=1 Tax=Escherichia coli TaxID=562 RepID=UPI00234CC8CC|nr:hypothetical protein [Escherichia coli]